MTESSHFLFAFYSWDDELAEVAQIWADQCANVIYFHASDIYPRIFHERGFERTTSRFNAPPGVGQNVAWALTKNVNFTRIIDDLWYRDINKLRPGRIGDFQVCSVVISMEKADLEFYRLKKLHLYHRAVIVQLTYNSSRLW